MDIFTSMLRFEQVHKYLIYVSSYTKAFNSSGLPLSYSICFDEELHEKINNYKMYFGIFPNLMNLNMLEVLYTSQEARDWKKNTNKYIMNNYNMLK